MCEAHSGEQEEQPPIPGFTWPEGQTELEDKARKLVREAEKSLDDAAGEVKKQIKKATGKPL